MAQQLTTVKLSVDLRWFWLLIVVLYPLARLRLVSLERCIAIAVASVRIKAEVVKQ
jgi:hypothetical protein